MHTGLAKQIFRAIKKVRGQRNRSYGMISPLTPVASRSLAMGIARELCIAASAARLGHHPLSAKTLTVNYPRDNLPIRCQDNLPRRPPCRRLALTVLSGNRLSANGTIPSLACFVIPGHYYSWSLQGYIYSWSLQGYILQRKA